MTDSPRLILPRKPVTPGEVSAAQARPAVVTPDYGEDRMASPTNQPVSGTASPQIPPAKNPQRQNDPFEGFGDRLASRPFALRLPRPVDLVIRQIAAENQVQPLRVVDQAVRDYLAKLRRLPEMPDA